MKSILIIALVSISLSHAIGQSKTEYNIDNSNVALSGFSPVSYLDLGLAQRGVKTHKSTYDDVIYYFTNEEQKAKFDKDPERYLPQFGGYCAFGIYVGAKFRTDPNKFLVKDDQYFLFLNDLEVDAKQLWLAEDHKKLASKANMNWKKLRSTYN